MLIGVLVGGALGCATKLLVSILLFGGFPAEVWALQFMFAIVLVFEVPGPFLLSIPLSFVLVRKRRSGLPGRKLLFIALCAGILLGVVDQYITVALHDLHWRGSFRPAWPEPELLLVCLLGGLAMGVGCFLGLPRKAGGP